MHISMPASSTIAILSLQLFQIAPSQAREIDDAQPSRNSTRVNWSPPTSYRNTWDILLMCGTVFIICTWSCVHLNLPTIAESEAGWYRFHKVAYWPQKLLWRKWGRRIGLMIVVGVIPELAVAIAVQQRIDAENCLREARKIINDPHEFKISHGYLANMGGIVLKTENYFDTPSTDGSEHGSTSTTAWDFMSLQGLAEWQKKGQRFEIAEKDIADKSKSDALAKLIAIAQCCSLVIQTIARSTAGLATTQLELLTLAFAANAVLAYIIWRDKPFGVERHVVFVLSEDQRSRNTQGRGSDCSLTTIKNESTEILPSGSPPNEHEGVIYSGRNMYRVDNIHNRFEEFQHQRVRNMGVHVEAQNSVPTSLNDGNPATTSINTPRSDLGWEDCVSSRFIKGNLTFYSMGSVTAAIQVLAWNWSFPTRLSRTIWRVFGIGSFIGILIPMISLTMLVLSRAVLRSDDTATQRSRSIRRKLSSASDYVFGLITAVYMISRVGSLVLTFYCLSSLPDSAYESIQWTSYLPSFS